MSTLMSPKVFSYDGDDMLASTHLSSGFAAHEKRHLIENFLKDEHVFQLLYETVFSSQTENQHARDAVTLKTNSCGQVDIDGNELPRSYVREVSNANEQLFEAVVAGAASIKGGHRRN